MRTDLQQVLDDLIVDMWTERQLPHRDLILCEQLREAVGSIRRVRDRVESLERAMWDETTIAA